jgi:subtilase family serine protease
MYRIQDAVNPNAIGPDNPYFTPQDIYTAYNLPGLTGTEGAGTTIAIVDAYSDPNIASNLATFSGEWSLPAANLVIHQMSTGISSNSGWGMEESLDVEWAHAIAPEATILLVEATSATTSNLLSAVSYAASQKGVVSVSMSWGSNDFSGEQQYDTYFATSGISFFASAGDTGGVVTWPSCSQNVISVGGTTLTQTATGYTESAWSSGGGGTSAYEAASTYQAQALGNSMSETPDVAYNANPNTGFLVCDTYGYSGWYAVGGTSAGAPQWAAIQSLGLTATKQNFYNDYKQPSTYAKDFTDITTGSNGHPAGTGYDLATGLGSPLTTNFQPATTPDFSLSATPITIQTATSLTGTSTITATPISGYSNTISLSVTNAPTGWTTLFSSNTISGGSGTSALSITVPSTVTAGTYSISVQGTDPSGTPIHTTTVTVTIATPYFSLSASPVTIQAGTPGTSTVTATSLNQYAGTISTLSASAPNGWSASFNPTSITLPSNTPSSALTITVPSSTSSGTYSVTVMGTDTNGLSNTATLTVTVINPNFSISASPTSLSIRSGSRGTSTITIGALNGFTGKVSLSTAVSGGGLTTTLNPAAVTKSGTSTLTINVPSTTRSGAFTVTVTGTSGSLTHSVNITVNVSRN